MFQNIIFDFDGTLVDSKKDIADAQLWVLRQLGVNHLSHEDLFPLIGKSLPETFSVLLPHSMHDRIEEAATLYADYYPPRSLQTTTLFPGVKEGIMELTRYGRRLAVASTKKGTGILRATNHFGITEFFVQLQGSEGLPFKPDPAVVERILDDQEWSRNETIMVGDTDGDILAAQGARIASCAVTYGSLIRRDLVQVRPDFIIDDFTSLLPIVGVTNEPR